MTQSNHIAAMVGKLIASWVQRFDHPVAKPPEFPVDREILDASPEEQRAFVIAAIQWLEGSTTVAPTSWPLLDSLMALLRRNLPFTHDDLLALLGWANRHAYGWRVEPHIGKLVTTYLATNPRTPALEAALAELIGKIERRAWDADARRRVLKLKELAGIDRPALPLLPGDVWADAAIAEIGALEPEQCVLWAELLQYCAAAGGSAPSTKWRKAALALVERIGPAEVRAATLRWLPLAERPRETLVREHWGGERDSHLMQERNVDALRGLVWLCAEDDSREVARALAAFVAAFYRKLPGVGPRSARLGNAGIWALGQMPGQHGMAQLTTLKTRVKLASALKQIETALAAAAARAGLPADEVEELLVPTYGLAEVGLRRELLGDVSAELFVGAGVELRYTRADGKKLAAAPKALKAEHGAALGELTKATADIKAMLPAQRDRIEQLYLKQKSWSLATWRERYLDHPLVGTLARRLIWRCTSEGHHQPGIWHEGQLVGADGQPLAGLGEQTIVALWHPLDGTTEEALAWREWLAAHEVQQPFKQAYREIYLLTDAERASRVYSNRFAAHILRQHQFNALCVARGWKNQLRLMVDDSYPPASRLLPEWGLRAEYWVEGAGDNYGADTNGTGTYLHLVTDQVRFYPVDAAQRYAHAGGGGYHPSRWRGAGAEHGPIPLEEIQPLVLSEVLRDVDLFVGVASVGNDPNWADGGPEGRHRNYWERYAFGDLSETAKTRRAVLERLIPRLKIASRCRLSERFLHVRGDLRSYKIHLGSGNIMMEPNDQYLCIVPARGATAGADGMRFVPFEGDGTLAIILSKALLLAEDAKISDPTITRQLQR